jgi:hypothetical protein
MPERTDRVHRQLTSHRRPWLRAAAAAGVVTCATATACARSEFRPTETPSGVAVLVGAGDIGYCGSKGLELTARLLDTLPGTVFTAGDNAYPRGSAEDFANCYAPTWGRHRSRTRPSPGNHDYESAGAAPYFEYFGDRAGPGGVGYYSYDLGAWHLVSLNSMALMASGSPQDLWLRADLAAHQSICTLAYWHHPLFSSGEHGNDTRSLDAWRTLYERGVDVVLNGHDHGYERFAPQSPDGRPTPNGIREFVVGTGGAPPYGFPHVQINSEVRHGGSYGVLQLTLRPDGYDWMFLTVESASLDSGSATCRP